MSSKTAIRSQKWLYHLGSLTLMLGVISCGKQTGSPKETAQSKAPQKAAVTASNQEVPKPASDSSANGEHSDDDRSKDIDLTIGVYKRTHPFRDATELLKQEAFLAKLGPLLQAAVKEHGFQDRVQKSVDFAAQLKQESAAPGTYRLDLKVDNYTPERTDRLLGAVLSGDPERLVKFVTDEVNEAAVEFTYTDKQERTANGISLQPNPQAPPPPP